MPISRRTLIGVIAAIVLLVALFVSWPTLTNEQDYEKVAQSIFTLYNSQSYLKIIERYKAYDWAQESYPDTLMVYCSSLVEAKSPIPSNLKPPSVPRHIAQFAEAYVMMLQGHVRKSRSIFDNLITQSSGKAWGYVALLELALYTQNITSMEPLLSGLSSQKEKGGWIAERALPYYSLMYHYYMANYEEAVPLAKKLAEDLQDDDEQSAIVNISLLLRENHFAHARGALQNAYSLYGETQDLILTESDILLLRSGFESSAQFLEEKTKTYPEKWKVKQQYAFDLLETGRQSVVDEAVKIIMETAQTRLHDLPTVIIAAGALLDFGYYKDAGKLMDELSRLPAPPTEFMTYNLLMAKADSLSERQYSLKNNLAEARKMSPMDPSMLWLSYRVAMSEGNSEVALDILRKLLHLDPYNQAALASMAEMYAKLEQWDKVREPAQKLLSSKRHVNHKLVEEMRAYVAQASSVK